MGCGGNDGGGDGSGLNGEGGGGGDGSGLAGGGGNGSGDGGGGGGGGATGESGPRGLQSSQSLPYAHRALLDPGPLSLHTPFPAVAQVFEQTSSDKRRTVTSDRGKFNGVGGTSAPSPWAPRRARAIGAGRPPGGREKRSLTVPGAVQNVLGNRICWRKSFRAQHFYRKLANSAPKPSAAHKLKVAKQFLHI